MALSEYALFRSRHLSPDVSLLCRRSLSTVVLTSPLTAVLRALLHDIPLVVGGLDYRRVDTADLC